MSELEVRSPRPQDEAGVRAAQRELAEEDFEFAFDLDDAPDFTAWVARCEAEARGDGLRPGWVRSSFLLGLLDGEVAGRVSVRHELSAALRTMGGHVGYAVRPGFRGQGVATALLDHALELLATEGVQRALLTTAEDNEASRRIIERAGGVLEDASVERRRRRPVDDEAVAHLRYWVATG